MQTLEEKKALLQRAMDEGLEVEINQGIPRQVIAIRECDAWGLEATTWESGGGFGYFVVECKHIEIVEHRVTAEDLCKAIEAITTHVTVGQDTRGWWSKSMQRAVDLAAKYREQEANDE